MRFLDKLREQKQKLNKAITEKGNSSRKTKEESDKKKWCHNKLKVFLFLASLVIFLPIAPIGIFILWKYTDWNNRTKWILTLVFSVLFIWVWMILPKTMSPTIKLKNMTNNIEVESSEYTIEGKLTPSSTKLKINEVDIPVDSGGNFSYIIQLKDGNNEIVLIATNGDKTMETKQNIKKLSAEEIARRKAEAEAKVKEEAEKKTQEEAKRAETLARQKTQEEERKRQENLPINKITLIVKSVGDFEVTIWDVNGNMANENTPSPYEVIVNTNQTSNCGGAKVGLYNVMNKLYTDDSVKDKIARVKFSAMGYLRASLGSNDVSKDKNNSNYWSGSSNFWATFLVYKPYEDETGQIEQRTWGLSINNCK